MVTIKDIAEEAGVSFSTVSKALRNSPLVKDKTKKHILQIAEQLGYQPNIAARSLVSKKSGAIGVVWPSVERAALSSLLTALNDTLEAAGYTVLLSISNIEAALATFYRFQVDAIIVFGDEVSHQLMESVTPPNTPIITYGAADFSAWSTVDVRREQSIRLALQHLTALGHQNIAYIGALEVADPLQTVKVDAFQEEATKLALPLHSHSIVPITGLQTYDGYVAMKQLLASPHQPTAVISGGIDLTRGILRATSEANLLVPNDLSIVSYDNIPQMEEFEVPMTVVGVAISTIAKAITNTVNALVAAPKQHTTVHLEPELVIRTSTSVPKKQ
ncbi:LacI family DNA-binding transcriptional regulator [Paenibacillus yanchengensis]|uniref:LacI family DNA-binding transcriptional regulator n=1 Tax=Paenibacillus yanchengensis TaxID=2035833 RepID=A0ABW4YGL5_9BACL